MTNSKPSISRHIMNIHFNSAPRSVCSECGLSFKSNMLMLKHAIKVHDAPGIECPKCDKKFAYPSSLQKHDQQTHLKIVYSKINPGEYDCSYCSLNFKLHSALLKHESMHRDGSYGTRERGTLAYKINCEFPGCSRQFKRNLDYQRHYTSHTGENNYCCKYCDKRFRGAKSLRKHLETIHKLIKPVVSNDPAKSLTTKNY